jgi:lysophospholipid acyltransferase
MSSTVASPPGPTGWEANAADALGVSCSQFRFTVAFFLSVVVGALFRVLPNPRSRHIYAAITGFLLIYYPFGGGVLNALVPAALSYVAMLRFREHAATLTWLTSFGYLLWCHIGSASGQAWKEGKMDFTGAQMVLTLKLISVAVCYQDGLKQEEDLTAYQQSHRLTELPSPLAYMSYLFAGGNLLAGPFFEIKDYLQFVNREGVWASDACRRGSPNPLVPGLVRLAKGILCAGLHLYFNAYFPVGALESAWFPRMKLLQKIGFIYAVAITYRLRYYFAWAVSESSLIFSGLSFNGYDDSTGRATWDRCVNTRMRKVELSNSAARLPADWNVATGNFLRRYVYDRLTPKGRKPQLSTLVITQVVSGLWHGIFPGYALFFVSCAFFFNSSKVMYRYERNWSSRAQNNLLWRFVKLLYTQLTLQYLGAAFMVLQFNSAFAVWRSVHFYGHLAIAAITMYAVVFPPKRPSKPVQPAGTGVDQADGAVAAHGSKEE